MAIRTALLNWNNISRDTDFSKYIESVSEPWVIEWLEVSATKVWIWKAFVPCLRTNGETIYALVYISSEVSISGNGDVFIEVSQTYIDDWELANEDWTGIATIQVWTMPSKNALKLATISSWTVTDARNMIPKVWELNTQIVSIFDELADLDERVEALEEAGAIDHLEESGLVGELYTLNDTLFKQYTPALVDSTLDCNVSDVADNTEIHIQRIASGVASNQLKLKVKMVGESTQNLKVEVRKWVQVTVTEWVEAYWYWNQVVASGSIPYSEISTDYAEKTITLDNEFWWTKGELLDVVVYMDTVNSTNYYCVACDSTQYSEWFSYVSVNGSTRTRSKLMPYCLSDGFAQSLLVKAVESISCTIYDEKSTRSPATSSTIVLSGIDYVKPLLPDNPRIKMTVNLIYSTELNSSSHTIYPVYVKKTSSTDSATLLVITDKYVSDLPITKSTITTSNYTKSELSENMHVYYYNGGYSSSSSCKLYLTFEVLNDFKKWDIQIVPNRIESLWNLATWVMFWLNPDWTWNDWPYKSKETTEATTWNITPWNFVWYIQIWKYKIPYYL